jgi:hypothetical protein
VTTLMAVDYDHDGYTDFVGRDPDQLFVWRNTYNGSFRIGGGVSLGLGWSVFNKLIPGDFNGDGKPDIAGVTNDGDQVWIVPNTSSGSTLSRGTSSYLSSGWKTISTFMAGDYDHDGTTDFVGRDPDQLFVWRVTYNGTYHISSGVSLGLGWSTISAFVTQN